MRMLSPPWWSLALLLVSFGVVGCPDDDDDSAVDDDDSLDDDDATTDDDDASDDDDATPPDPISCDGDLPVFVEGEVNDTPEDANDIELPPLGFCFEGSMSCGDQGYQDIDLARFTLPVDRDVRVVLEWTSDADFDKYVWEEESYDPGGGGWVIPFRDGYVSPEDHTGPLDADIDYLLEVGCWAGQDGDYTVTVTYADLESGDDDDSAGDDDDSATGDDDDDSATGDDDDSATGDDDDDSAGDDDDDSATGDDDDSAPGGDDDDSAD